MCSVLSALNSLSNLVVDPYLWPYLPKRYLHLPTYDIGGEECMMVTRDDACCWVVYCHGNSVTLADLWESGIPTAITESCRCNFVAPNYPQKTSSGEQYDRQVVECVQRVYEQLQQDTNSSVYLIGRSIGAAIATRSCQNSKPSGLVLISGFSSVRQQSPWPLRWFIPDRLNNLKSIRNLKGVPTLIIHGKNDALVSPENADEIAHAHGNAEVIIVPDMTHIPLPANINVMCSHIRRLIDQSNSTSITHHYSQWRK